MRFIGLLCSLTLRGNLCALLHWTVGQLHTDIQLVAFSLLELNKNISVKFWEPIILVLFRYKNIPVIVQVSLNHNFIHAYKNNVKWILTKYVLYNLFLFFYIQNVFIMNLKCCIRKSTIKAMLSISFFG